MALSLKNNKKLSFSLCLGASALVLSACMPDDEAADKRAEASHDTAKVAHYSQAFQQYSARSLNAIVNSDLWASQTLPEGSLTLTSSAFGSLDLGGSEAYVQSAYCVIAGTPRHLTWFETENADGSLFLQGLGAERAGESASKLREMIARENFGIAGGDSIAMADGSVLDPVGGCNALNIPDGSVVAVVPIPVPTQVAETQEKYIMRALDCPAGTEGNRLERIMATYMPSGNISVGVASFATEAAVMADNGLAWESLANNCLAPSEAIARVIVDTSVDALDVANIINIPGEITEALDTNLTDKTCKDVHDKKDNGEDLSDEESKMYDTCAGPVELNPLAGIEYDDDDLVKEEEEIITGQCGGEAGSAKTITIAAPGSANFRGIHGALGGKSAQLSTTDWSGDSTYRKITRFYEIVEDFGNGQTGRGGASSDGNCDNGGCTTVVTYEAEELTCARSETLTIPCNEMYNVVASAPTNTGGGVFDGAGSDGSNNDDDDDDNRSAGNTAPPVGLTLVTDDGLDYTRSRLITGWADVTALIPNDPDDRNWTQGSMNCVWNETRTTSHECAIRTEQRTFTATSPDNGQWGGWQVVNIDDSNCNLGGSGTATGHGSSCVVAGTLIAMADGSTKRIENVQIGEQTLGGRVLQKYVRAYDDALAMTADGIMNSGRGLFMINGVIATGRHPFYLDNKWQELQFVKSAQKVFDPSIEQVYNLLTEHHIVPVQGLNGDILLTSDDLNNYNNASNKGLLKVDISKLTVNHRLAG